METTGFWKPDGKVYWILEMYAVTWDVEMLFADFTCSVSLPSLLDRML
jgi:branched-subunit amino acid transport protein